MDLRCPCGAFLAYQPDKTEPAEYRKTCDGKWHDYYDGGLPVLTGPACGKIADHEPHDYADSSCVILHRRCHRCRRDNQEVSYVV
jgi:hypothetical protein